MTVHDLNCPRCGEFVRLLEKASRSTGKLVYRCRGCGRRYSFRSEVRALVEEHGVDESGERTLRLKAYRPDADSVDKLKEVRPPSSTGALPQGVRVTLEFTDGPDRGRSFRVRRTRSVVGRRHGEIPLRDPLISRRHAVVEIHDPETIILKDLASTNGTYHNGHLIDHCKLHDGDEVRFGGSILNVLIEHAARAGP
jgi:tRNA(Ile2) C34 agmatinyltransferase TiaS